MDLRNLPTAVLKRLEGHPDRCAAGQWRGLDAVLRAQTLLGRGGQDGAAVEARSAPVELRADDNGDPVLEGYACVYEYPYEVAGGPPWGWTEVVAAGACAKSVLDRDNVRLLFDHEGMPFASVKPRTLALASDETGLHVETPAGLDMTSPDVQGLVSAMRRGDLDEMSFAFRVLRQEWNEDYTERRILEVKLYDVSVVTFPANPATVAQLRADPPVTDPPVTELEPEPTGIGLAYARALASTI